MDGTRRMATHEEPRIRGGIRRRSVLRGGLLVGVGLTAAGLASAALTGTAKAVSPQPNWAYCKLCHGMWYTGNGTNGACPGQVSALLGHVKSPSYNYELFNSSSGGGSSPGYQPNWYWCSQCQGLFTTLYPGDSCCPGYAPRHGGTVGPHTAVGSFEYG
jgi:hypothetical protein